MCETWTKILNWIKNVSKTALEIMDLDSKGMLYPDKPNWKSYWTFWFKEKIDVTPFFEEVLGFHLRLLLKVKNQNWTFLSTLGNSTHKYGYCLPVRIPLSCFNKKFVHPQMLDSSLCIHGFVCKCKYALAYAKMILHMQKWSWKLNDNILFSRRRFCLPNILKLFLHVKLALEET